MLTSPKSVTPKTHLPKSSKLLIPTIESIRKLPLLAEISDEEAKLILKDLRIEQIHRRQTVIQKGSLPDSLIFLLSGQMQVIDLTESGKEVGLRILSAGEFFGELSVITGSPRTTYVVSLTNSVVAFMPRSTALYLFSHSPSVANKILKLMAEKITSDSELRTLLSIHNASKRVLALLQSLKTINNNGDAVIESLPTHQEIAIMVNTSRETVTRTLLSLKHQGIILNNSGTITIRNSNALLQLMQA